MLKHNRFHGELHFKMLIAYTKLLEVNITEHF